MLFSLTGFTVGFLWLLALTFLYLRLLKQTSILIDGSSKKSLPALLEDMLRQGHLSKKEIESLISRCDKIEKESQLHIQKIGLLRFNPFKDTGGDQSFILSLVDAQ